MIDANADILGTARTLSDIKRILIVQLETELEDLLRGEMHPPTAVKLEEKLTWLRSLQ